MEKMATFIQIGTAILIALCSAIAVSIFQKYSAYSRLETELQIMKKEIERLESDRKQHEILNEKVFDKIEKKLDEIFVLLTKHSKNENS